MNLATDVARSLAQMGDPRFRSVMWRALLMVVATLAALVSAVTFALGRLVPETVALPWVGEVGFFDGLVSWAAVGVMLALSVVLMVPATAAAAGFFLDDVAEAVEAQHYPGLPPPRSLGFGRQALDSVRFLGLVVAANLAALVVYLLLPPLAPVAFWLVNGFLLGREYFQLVALRRLAPDAAQRLRRAAAGRIWLAGIAMALPLSVPVVNLFVPVLGVAVFTHQFHRIAGDARPR